MDKLSLSSDTHKGGGSGDSADVVLLRDPREAALAPRNTPGVPDTSEGDFRSQVVSHCEHSVLEVGRIRAALGRGVHARLIEEEVGRADVHVDREGALRVQTQVERLD